MGRSIGLACVLAAFAFGPGVARASEVGIQAPTGGAWRASVTSLRDLPFRTVVRQQYDFSCGSAALATLLRYHYGLPMTEADVFQTMYAAGDQAAIRRLGFSLLDMKRFLASQGMTADGYRLPLDVLAKAQTPAIAVISIRSYKHFVVIKGLRDGRLLVGDPAMGLHAYPLGQFAKVWDGVIFVIHDRSQAGTPLRKAVFDSNAEWAQIPFAPLRPALDQQMSISELTRSLPIDFQITPVISQSRPSVP